MQALILAAGTGSRLGKYTEDNTKCMIKVNGTTLIEQCLEKLNSVGITRLILVVGYKRENLQNFLGDKYKNVEIKYVVNPIYDKTNNIYSLFLAKEHLLVDDTILIESDLIFEEKILRDLLEDKRKSLAVVDKYQSWMDGTVVMVNSNNSITNFIPKKFFDYNDINKYYKTVNIYKFSKEFSANTYIPFLKAYSTALGDNEYYEQVLRVVTTLENQELQAFKLDGEKWYEIDDVQDKNNAETIFAPSKAIKLERVQERFGGFWRYPSLIDFCYLVNPYFPTVRLEKEMKTYFSNLLREYPSGLNIQNLLAGRMFNVEPDEIIVGNGAAELIRGLAHAIKGKVGVVFPTFNEYPESFGMDKTVQFIPKNNDFSYTIDDLMLLSETCSSLLLVNPDNPSGHFIRKKEILDLLGRLKTAGKTLILDESFVDFSDYGEKETMIHSDILETYNNLIVIKSISKSYGVPGARLGVLATGNKKLLAEIRSHVSIWNINSFGEFFLQIISKYQKEYRQGCIEIVNERNRFYKELNKIRFLRVIPSQANYFMCEVIGKDSATELTETLLYQSDIFIKDLTGKVGFENKNYVRIAIRNEKDNDLIINKLKKIQE